MAINAGVSTGLAVDQRGLARPSGGGSDIGAFEVQVAATSSLAAADLSRDQIVSALDVLLVVNRLNAAKGEGEATAAADPLDVNRDGCIGLLLVGVFRRRRR